ncbi:hypothetical protein DF147_04690 [Burkholderia cenocepacia]|nr:hypothetical protein DF147_04690 [Burkholderia cenocepacia]RQV90969.1 hypothetical protein DF019_04715 [Burkholderia cenocepacia]
MHSGYRLKTGRQYDVAPAIDAGQETNRRIVSVGVVTGRRARQTRAKAAGNPRSRACPHDDATSPSALRRLKQFDEDGAKLERLVRGR